MKVRPQRDYRTAGNSPSGTIADSDLFAYDRVGQMTPAISGRDVNTVSMSYDPTGRLATEGLTIAGQTYSTMREYDALNRIKKYIYPDGTQVERTYTNRSQLNQLKYNSAVIDTRTYDIGGRLSTSTYSNGAVTTWNYRVSGANKDNLLANIATTNPGANKVGTYTYTWDANRNKTAETITNSPLSGFGFSTGSNGYDNENRVTAWNRSDSNQNQTWNLSLVGNWNMFNQTGTGPFNQTRTHGLAHEFTSFTGTSSGTLAYDVKGNLISRPATLAAPALNLTWDFDNRLGGADTDGTPASNEVTFQYDALGRRVVRTESGITTVFVQVGQQTFTDYASGAAPSSPTYRYVYAEYIDEPVMRETASGSIKHFYHRNQQYSITALTDSSGNTAERYAYTANGVLTIFNATGTQIPTSALSNRYTYTGREWDNGTQTYFFRARIYDPKLGRFLGRDPLGYEDGLILHASYFGLSGVDPSGLYTCKCTCTETGQVYFEGHSGTMPPTESVSYITFNATDDASAADECSKRCGDRNFYIGDRDNFQSRSCKGTIVNQEDEIANLRNCSQSLFDAWYRHELHYLSTTNWTKDLPACPCSVLCIRTCTRDIDPEPKITVLRTWTERVICNPNENEFSWGNNPWLDYYHPGGVYELRAIDGDNHGQQCIYDENGDLTYDIPTAGSTDWRSPGAPWNGEHKRTDMQPWECAKTLDDRFGGDEFMKKYYEVRPVNGGKPCENY